MISISTAGVLVVVSSSVTGSAVVSSAVVLSVTCLADFLLLPITAKRIPIAATNRTEHITAINLTLTDLRLRLLRGTVVFFFFVIVFSLYNINICLKKTKYV